MRLFSPKSWPIAGCAALCGALLFTLFSIDPVLAQNWGRSPWIPDTTHWRVLIMVAGGAGGFTLGWFFSPYAREFRALLAVVGSIIIILFAIIDNGALGWGLALFASLVLFCAGLGFWLGQAAKALAQTPTTFGSARWATRYELECHGLVGSGGIYLGEFEDFKGVTSIEYFGDLHLFSEGKSRGGKGTCVIIPNLLSYQGSMLVIDPKGENALITAKHRRDVLGQKVHIVDPWGITASSGLEPSCFNPLDWLVKGDIDISDNGIQLADAIIIMSGGDHRFWSEEAKGLLLGLLLYVATAPEEEGQRHLGRVRDLMLKDKDGLAELFKHMCRSPLHVVASTGMRCIQKEEKLLANVLASLQAETHFLDSPRLRESLSCSDFSFEDLKRGKVTIYLVLPADRLESHGRWLRLLVQQALTVNARNIEIQPDKPILFMLDEMTSLGRLAMVEQAFSLMAGYGMQLWGFVQDFSRLEEIYGKGWQSFIANAGVLQYLGSRDEQSTEYFSKLCGVTTVWSLSSAIARAFTTSFGDKSNSSGRSVTTTETISASQRRLIYADELNRLGNDQQLLLIDNLNPIIAARQPWFENPDLKDKGVNLRGEQTDSVQFVAQEETSPRPAPRPQTHPDPLGALATFFKKKLKEWDA